MRSRLLLSWTKKTWVVIALVVSLALSAIVLGQFGQRQGGRPPEYGDRVGVPTWDLESGMTHDVFTFARVMYRSASSGWGRGGGLGRYWQIDFPNSDLNFSYRLEQLTSLKVAPDGIQFMLMDDDLDDYPFLYLTDPRYLTFTKEEATALRDYLLNGGFLMVDDFWGGLMWEHFMSEMEQVFPDREPKELPFEHSIFSCVFPLKEKPQVASEDAAHAGRYTGVTWEDPYFYGVWESVDTVNTPHYWAYYDDNDRMMAILCHNTDLGDGWEEEGISKWFFENFSEKFSYPMGINILFYAMTH